MNKSIPVIIILIGLIIVGIMFWKDQTTPSASSTSTQASGTQQAPSASSDGVADVASIAGSRHVVTLETTLGQIQIATYDEDAPKAVNNFISLVKKGFYNTVIFHRVIKGFMIQGGDPTGTGMGGPGYKFEDELNPNTISYKNGYKKGVVAMANAGPNTNGSQFFIMHEDYPLDHNYTIFGVVIRGQDVVDKIANQPTGEQDRPIQNIAITSATVKDN